MLFVIETSRRYFLYVHWEKSCFAFDILLKGIAGPPGEPGPKGIQGKKVRYTWYIILYKWGATVKRGGTEAFHVHTNHLVIIYTARCHSMAKIHHAYFDIDNPCLREDATCSFE